MTVYAFFYDKHGYNPCGDRSLIQIDGRLNRPNLHAIAGEECKKRGFVGYNMIQAENLRYISVEQIASPDKIYYPVTKTVTK